MRWRWIVLGTAATLGLAASSDIVQGQNTTPAEEQGGKAKVHHKKVYAVADEAARTLKDIEEKAYEATDHAGTIQVAAGPVASSQEFHSSQLEALREDVNRMGEMMQRLETLGPDEASWQRRTVKRAMPLLKNVAASTEEAIRFVSDKPQKLALPDYQKISKRLYDQSTALWKVLHDSVRLADLRERELRMRKDLRNAT